MSLVKFASIILLSLFYTCQDHNKTVKTQLVYKNNKYDFGNIEFKQKATCYFYYSNNGSKSLSIKFVKMNCGCLNSVWSENEIQPGDTGRISIQKDTGVPGYFKDRILVYYNELLYADTLEIKGNVIYP